MFELPLRLRSEWLVVIARGGAPLPADLDQGIDRAADRVGLTDAAAGPFRWRDPSDRVLVAAWPGPDEPTPVQLGPEGLTVVRGQLREVGRPWTDPATWPRSVASLVRGGRGHPMADLVGDGSVVAVDPTGRGRIAADALGGDVVFAAGTDRFDVITSRSALAAWTIAPPDCRRVRRDTWPAACFATVGYVVGPTTGYVGVERLGVGTVVDVTPDGGARRSTTRPWLDGADHDLPPTVEAVCDRVEAALFDQMRAVVGLADAVGQRVVVDLTGGKDSRLVLATALRLGLVGPGTSDRVVLRTDGEPHDEEVQVASRVAAAVGAAHESGVRANPNRRDPRTELDTFQQLTEGLLNAWSTAVPRPGPGRVRVSATVAELLRADTREASWTRAHGLDGRPDVASVAASFTARWDGPAARFVPPDVRRTMRDRVEAMVQAEADLGFGADTWFGALAAGHYAVRLTGRLLAPDVDHRVVLPLSLEAVRAAQALPALERRLELVHRTLIARADPRLDAMAFGGSSRWPERPARPSVPRTSPVARTPPRRFRLGTGLRRRWRTSRADRPADRPGTAPAGHDHYATTALARARTSVEGPRADLVRDMLSDRSNPIWELLDATAVDAALADLGQVPMTQIQELHGLAGAARWMWG